MKIYRNGTLCRRGCGGLPEIGISGMSFTYSSLVVDQMLDKVPQEILDINAVYKLKSNTLPGQTIITTPKTDLQIRNHFNNYTLQILRSSRQWDLTLFSKEKIYTSKDGVEVRLDITRKGEMFNFDFTPYPIFYLYLL
jgi:hypothetical protein